MSTESENRESNKNGSRYKFTHDCSGLHVIQAKDGARIIIDASDLSMADIRELLSGFGNIMQSISTHTWNKDFGEPN